VLAQVVAEEFGLRPEQIGSYIGDTRYPIGPPSGGSRVTGSLTPAARNAAHRAARDLAAHIASSLQDQAEDIVFADGGVFVRGKPETALPFKDAIRRANVNEISHRADRRDDYDGYAMQAPNINISRHGIGGVQFTEVTVDMETGVVKIERIVAVHDCGWPINPKLVES
jgi:xanthine dehydrogenase YagR molybdenum-binding subunit